MSLAMTYRTVPSLLAGLAVAVVAAGAGCGGDDEASGPDALTPGDSGPLRDGGDPCDYQEADDDGNAETGEPTGLTVDDSAILICGDVAARAPEAGVVDRDRYEIAIAAAGDYVVRLRAADGRDVTMLEVHLVDGNATLGRGIFVGSHAVFLGQLDSGAITVEVVAGHPAAPPAAITYHLEIAPDDRTARCPAMTGTATFTEVGDTAGNFHTGNDMVEVSSTGDMLAQTVATSDAPEATNLVVSDGMSYQLAGSLGVNGNAGAYADDYLDRDTFLIATGAQTTELAIRVTWPEDGIAGNDDDADLDVVLFGVPASATATPWPLIAGDHRRDLPPELEAAAVLPSSTYWLWVGNREGSAEPKPYELTICGVAFAP